MWQTSSTDDTDYAEQKSPLVIVSSNLRNLCNLRIDPFLRTKQQKKERLTQSLLFPFKNQTLIKVEVVFQLDVHRNGVSILCSRHKPYLPRRGNRPLG